MGVTMTWTARGEPSSAEDGDDDVDMDEEEEDTANSRRKPQSRTDGGFDILVASHSAELGGLLKLFRFELSETALQVSHPVAPYKTLALSKPASRIAFNTAQYPKPRHSQLLIADSAGTTRIYDPFTLPIRKRRGSGSRAEPGAFVGTFRSSFESVKNVALTPAVLPSRKAIIDAAWASDGRHIIALLADGEWGVWDVDRSGPSPPADPSAFSLRGYVGTAEKEGTSGGASSPKRGSRNSLAPMTPNTRKRKEETLFQGSASSSTVATRGGVSVASIRSNNGVSAEDSVLIWYGVRDPQDSRSDEVLDSHCFRQQRRFLTWPWSPTTGCCTLRRIHHLGLAVRHHSPSLAHGRPKRHPHLSRAPPHHHRQHQPASWT